MIDVKASTARATGQVIANLFAVGLKAGGCFGLGPHLDLAGSIMGLATGSGRLAGKAAALAKGA